MVIFPWGFPPDGVFDALAEPIGPLGEWSWPEIVIATGLLAAPIGFLTWVLFRLWLMAFPGTITWLLDRLMG